MVRPGQQDGHLGDEQRAEHVDGRLAGGDRELVQQHLERCGQCRASVEQDRLVTSLLRRLPEAEPPRSFTLPEPVGRPRWARATAWTRVASGLAAALFVVVLGIDLAGPPPVSAPMASRLEAEMDAAVAEERVAPPVPAPAPAPAPPAPAAPAAEPQAEPAPPAPVPDAPLEEAPAMRALAPDDMAAPPAEPPRAALEETLADRASGLRLAQVLLAAAAVLFAVVSFILARRERSA